MGSAALQPPLPPYYAYSCQVIVPRLPVPRLPVLRAFVRRQPFRVRTALSFVSPVRRPQLSAAQKQTIRPVRSTEGYWVLNITKYLVPVRSFLRSAKPGAPFDESGSRIGEASQESQYEVRTVLRKLRKVRKPTQKTRENAREIKSSCPLDPPLHSAQLANDSNYAAPSVLSSLWGGIPLRALTAGTEYKLW